MTASSRNKRRVLSGMVTSDRMDKTIAVQIEWRQKHAKYGKYIKRHAKYLAHDEEGQANVGDKVEICECRPLSRRKRWRLVSVIARAELPEGIDVGGEA